MKNKVTNFGLDTNGDIKPIIINNQTASPLPRIKVKDTFYIEEKFSVEGPYSQGDTFEIDLPDKTYFSYDNFGVVTPFNLNVDIDGEATDLELGTYVITFDELTRNTSVIFTLNDNAEKIDFIDEMLFRAHGEVIQVGDDIEIYPGVIVDIEDDDDHYLPGLTPRKISKYGIVNNDNRTIRWNLFINSDVGFDYMDFDKNPNASFEKRNNAVVYDDLQEGLYTTMEDITISNALRVPSLNGGPFAKVYIPNPGDVTSGNELQKVERSSAEMTYEQFEQEILSASVPTLGLFDQQRIILNLKDVPEMTYDQNHVNISEGRLASHLLSFGYVKNEEDAKEAEAIMRELYVDGANDNQILEYYMNITSYALEPGRYSNRATYQYNTDNFESYTTGEYEIKDATVSGTTRVKGALKIVKTDEVTGESLENVGFKLQKYNENTNQFEDYTAIRQELVKTTNENGVVMFNRLDEGEYKIIETDPLEGYETQLIYKEGSSETFTFLDSDQGKVMEIQNRPMNDRNTYKELTVNKVWENTEDFYPVDVILTKDGVEVGDVVTLSENNNWTHTWNNLVVEDSSQNYVYSVTELTERENFVVNYDRKEDTNIFVTITNTFIKNDETNQEKPVPPIDNGDSKPVPPTDNGVIKPVPPTISDTTKPKGDKEITTLPSTGQRSIVGFASILVVGGIIISLIDKKRRKN